MPDGERPCEFYLLRYVPNIVRGEFVNIGVLLYDSGENRLFPPRLLENFRRVRRLHPWADLGLLAALEKQIEADAATPAGNLPGYLERLQQFSNVLEFTAPKAVLTADPEAELDRLYDTYVAEPRYPTRLGAAVERSRAWVRSQLNTALRRAGLWEELDRGVRVEQFTHRGDRFKFDFGYRRNGNLGFLHALALEREVDRAKVLAYTMERISTRLGVEQRAARCTAIVEAPPENETAELSARILAEQSIAVVPVAELAEFTLRLRQELA
ncbi:MAG: DUF3037 domain-containing protein [Terriglobia bacterium]